MSPFGQTYSIIIEPLFSKLRKVLVGVQINYLNSQESVKLSAYADDVTVVIRGDYDVEMVKNALECYGKASSAKLTGVKAMLCDVAKL